MSNARPRGRRSIPVHAGQSPGYHEALRSAEGGQAIEHDANYAEQVAIQREIMAETMEACGELLAAAERDAAEIRRAAETAAKRRSEELISATSVTLARLAEQAERDRVTIDRERDEAASARREAERLRAATERRLAEAAAEREAQDEERRRLAGAIAAAEQYRSDAVASRHEAHQLAIELTAAAEDRVALLEATLDHRIAEVESALGTVQDLALGHPVPTAPHAFDEFEELLRNVFRELQLHREAELAAAGRQAEDLLAMARRTANEIVEETHRDRERLMLAAEARAAFDVVAFLQQGTVASPAAEDLDLTRFGAEESDEADERSDLDTPPLRPDDRVDDPGDGPAQRSPGDPPAGSANETSIHRPEPSGAINEPSSEDEPEISGILTLSPQPAAPAAPGTTTDLPGPAPQPDDETRARVSDLPADGTTVSVDETASEDGAQVHGAQSEPKRRRSIWRSVFLLVLVMGSIQLANLFIVETYTVQAASMEPELRSGDRLLVNKVVYRFGDPARGDIVVLDPADDTQGLTDTAERLVKRVVGLPGDVIESVDGSVQVNGTSTDQPWLTGTTPTPDFSAVTVPDGEVFVLGDNRIVSVDSRMFGTIEIARIEGKVIATFWPPSEVERH